jgi:hypothetical protein
LHDHPSGTRLIRLTRGAPDAGLLILWFLLVGATVPASGLELQIPIACEIGRTCEIQNYVDRDPGSGVQDHTCGTTTYDQHNGTDFRVPSLAAQQSGVSVLAAADGRVLRRRDGVEDVSVREQGRASVAGAECGNGVVIDHGEGWETQYCHLAKGSLRVKPGDRVKAGDPIGSVGLSGLTEYPHLHFTLRSNGKVVDPFAVGAEACGPAPSLWSRQAQSVLAYRTRVVLNTGFATGPVPNAMIEAGRLGEPAPDRRSPALVAYARVINVKKGDVQKLVLRGPDGATLSENTLDPVDRDKAQSIMFAGRKAPAGGWPGGSYEATYTAMSGDKIVAERSFRLELK